MRLLNETARLKAANLNYLPSYGYAFSRSEASGLGEEVELAPQLQEQLVRLQQLQQTLQSVVNQKQQVELELSEADKALAELEKSTDDTPVYKSVGSILVKSNRQTLLTELKERKELMATRVTVLGKQEDRTRERLKEIQEKLQERLRAPKQSSQ